MYTATATTNEMGLHLSGGLGLGKALKASDMYSEKIESPLEWEPKGREVLSILRYNKDRLTSIGALQLLQRYGDHAMSNCYLYETKAPRRVSIHCLNIKKAIVVNAKGGYVIRNI